jgi:hypothetical protein
MKTVLLFGLLAFTSSMWAQKPDPKIDAIEKHYDFLESETKAFRETMQKENEVYRSFIEKERSEHQNFLERTYTIAGVIVTLVIGLLTFFGLNTFTGINKSRREIESAATVQILEYSKSLNEAQARLQQAQQNFLDLENQYQQHINYYRNANPRNGRYLFIGSREKLDLMSQNELVRFVQVFGTTEQLDSDDAINGKLYPASYDVIVYRSEVDKEGQDGVLEQIVDELRPFPNTPLVVYAANRNEWLQGHTEQIFNQHKLVHLANNQVSLIDNVASAFRVAKLLPKKTA